MTSINELIEILKKIRPILELTDELDILLGTDDSYLYEHNIAKYIPHLSKLFSIGNEQVVLLQAPSWLKEDLGDINLDLNKLLDEEEGIIIDELKQSDSILVQQSISAYINKQYLLSIIGLSAYLEGLVAELIDKQNSWKAKIRQHVEELLQKCNHKAKLNDRDIRELCLYVTLKRALEKYAQDSHFSDEEPNYLNRHWIAHGRVRREIKKTDNLKMLSMVAGVIVLSGFRLNKQEPIK